MGRQRRRPTRSRRPWQLRVATGSTMLLALAIIWHQLSIELGWGGNLAAVITCTGLAILAWSWAIRSIRARRRAAKTLAQLRALSPDGFEEWVGERFRELGYRVRLVGTSGDHGVDLLAEKGDEVAVVQCKRYDSSHSVGEPILRDLYGTMHDTGANQAYLVTTSELTKPAWQWIEDKPIIVWDGDYLASLSKRATVKRKAPQAGQVAMADGQPSELEPDKLTCPRCGSPLVMRTKRGMRQAFLGCSRYPRCRYTQPLA